MPLWCNMWNHIVNGFLSRKHHIGLTKQCEKHVLGNNKFIIESDVSRACNGPLVTTDQGFVQPLVSGGVWNCQGDDWVAKGGHKFWPRVEVQSTKHRGVKGRVSHCPGMGSSMSIVLWKFWKLRRNLVQSGAFWREIDGSPVFHLCERKHCHNAPQWYWHIGLLF